MAVAVRSFMLVVVNSPYAGGGEQNAGFTRACVIDCLRRGSLPSTPWFGVIAPARYHSEDCA
ncbi:hypothetical protein EPN42_10950 [bacterium]|nr:MAG: hypothetical protein EPN42_10950 [bacterium]